MERTWLVRDLIMSAIADDFEDLDMIVAEVRKWAPEKGVLLVNSDEIVAGLSELLVTGLAKAYHLSATEPTREIAGLPALHEFSECYFLLTPQGKHAITDC